MPRTKTGTPWFDEGELEKNLRIVYNQEYFSDEEIGNAKLNLNNKKYIKKHRSKKQ
ncbi:hypothetical protein [Microaceticoccus formicicus]|uniref:hypothetical protein n=1 Tax=Microaceticoccus formicicus TaxID=3118105 RepID=UPI003CD0308C|nr:hypothetical protein VZL98_08085 [Peptoniphilaceae bacterium AMB_02]